MTLVASSPRGTSPRHRASALAEPRGEDLRRRLLDIARDQYMRLGFSAVTMDETAAEAGVSKKTLYQHFASKEALLLAVAEESISACDAGIRAILTDESATPVARLRRLMDYVAAIYGEMSLALVHDLRRHAPQVWQRIEEQRQCSIQNEFSALLREGRAKGDFRGDIETPVFLLIYAEVVRHVLNPAVFAHLKMDPTQVFETVCKVLFEGLLTEKARKEYHEKT